MSNQDIYKDSLSADEFGEPALPSGLNVLTILTFIGCGILTLFSLASPWLIKFSKNMMDKASEGGNELSAEQVEKMRLARENLELTEVNMVPLMIIGMIGIVLCFVGALWMRKLKKDGFWIYVVGQVLPIVGSVFIVGTSQYKEISSLTMLAVPLLFIVLYSMQRKHLVK